MQSEASHQLPDPFDGVEFGAVRRQELQDKVVGHGLAPLGVQRGVMVSGVVDYNDNLASASPTGRFEFAKEIPAGFGIEHSLWPGCHQFPVAQSDGTEVTDAFSCRCMHTDRIGGFWRNPHPAARAVLLKMNLIDGP